MIFTIVNWNVGGSKHLENNEGQRAIDRAQLKGELEQMLTYHKPHVVTLQEVVSYGEPGQPKESIIEYNEIPDYCYFSFPIFDSNHLSAQAAWNNLRVRGSWNSTTHFSQENAMMFRRDMPVARVVDLVASGTPIADIGESYIERVYLQSGLYFGDRNTEPRAALVAHLIFNPKSANKPLDVFVVNVHLTTLRGEREGVPQVDAEAERIRRAQLDIIFYGIVSRYNKWKLDEYRERGKHHEEKPGENLDRNDPVWIIAGDFNFTPESEAYTAIERMNFKDMIPQEKKGTGTKAKGRGNPPSLTVDYIFAGPVFTALDPVRVEEGIKNNGIYHKMKSSDHYPLYADIPLTKWE